MMTVFLNLAATVGLSIAALFGTDVRLIGQNSYFAAKNSTLHARVIHEQPKPEEPKQSLTLLKSISLNTESLNSTSRFIDQLLGDARGITIDSNLQDRVSLK